jgi:hypothetical protein|tara:strand:- start:140 stop:361 length:222 start_codon:yes stop_codon:yes gene_type:complete
MRDAVALETKGIPTAVVITTQFEREAHMQRVVLGMEDMEPVVISHPLSTLSDEEIDGRASEAAPQVLSVFLRK